MEKELRLRIKVLIIIIGLLLISILFIKFLIVHEENNMGQTALPPEELVESWDNVWIMNHVSDTISVFYDGEEKTLDISNAEITFADENTDSIYNEQIADITLSNGVPSNITIKSQKISGKLLSINADSVELEGAGNFPLNTPIPIYITYGKPSAGAVRDLKLGDSSADFVLDNDKIIAAFITREPSMENIRVLIKTDGFSGVYHDKITFKVRGDTDIVKNPDTAGEVIASYKEGEEITIDRQNPMFADGRIYISPRAGSYKTEVISISRNQGVPAYRGRFEVALAPEGLILINEVLLEEYLYAVVPSEMPASYNPEALKTQAVCARTFAYNAMQNAPLAKYGAHLDDSTSYQVYNNTEEHPQTNAAVKETAGRTLFFGDSPAETYYYSTSCGFSADASVWGKNEPQDFPYLTASNIGNIAIETYSDGGKNLTTPDMSDEKLFADYISKRNPDDFESNEPWYRWSISIKEVNAKTLAGRINERYASDPNNIMVMDSGGGFASGKITALGDIKNISVIKRGGGGVAAELLIEGSKGTVKVCKEYNIRYVLCLGKLTITKWDGSTGSAKTLLPSAFFIITPHKKNGVVTDCVIEGGGFGHGVGMSQNGANDMAKEGYSFEDILAFFYKGTTLK